MSEQTPPTLGAALPRGTGVCVINLDSRTDRWETFRQEMLPHFEGLPIDRISATLGTQISGYGSAPYFRGKKRDRTWAARGGCTLSHRDAMLHAKAKGWSHLLILEDDITIEATLTQAFLNAFQNALQSTRYDVCYLGFTDPVPPFRHLVDVDSGHALHQVFGCNTAHAYLLSASAIDHILNLLPSPPEIWPWLARHRAIDRFYYHNLSPKLTITALSPSLIIQRPCFSDIVGKNVASCAENHQTIIESRHLDSRTFGALMRSQAATFKRAACFDHLRALWKKLRGF